MQCDEIKGKKKWDVAEREKKAFSAVEIYLLLLWCYIFRYFIFPLSMSLYSLFHISFHSIRFDFYLPSISFSIVFIFIVNLSFGARAILKLKIWQPNNSFILLFSFLLRYSFLCWFGNIFFYIVTSISNGIFCFHFVDYLLLFDLLRLQIK